MFTKLPFWLFGFKFLFNLFEQVSDLKMLRTSLLTHAAFYAVASLRTVLGMHLIVIIGVPIMEGASAV